MPNQVTRRGLVRWLRDHGFDEAAGRATGHRKFVHGESGVAITVPGHGPPDLTKKHVGMILRALERAGFDRDAVRHELQDAS